jgi:hypothetical protein
MSLLLSQPKLDVSGPVTPVAGFDPPAIRIGERATYRLTFNALEQSVQLPDTILTQPSITLEPRAHGQVLQTFANKQIPLAAFNFRCRPDRAGDITVPEFVVQVDGKPVTVPAAQLRVVDGPLEPIPVQQLFLDLQETNVFVGQPVRVRVRFPGNAVGGVQGFAQGIQFIGEGFLPDASATHQSIQVLPYGQTAVATYLHESTLIPISPGPISFFAQGFASGNRFSGPIVISGSVTFAGGIPQYTLVESDSVQLEAKPLPVEGQLPGFNGAFGNLSLDAPQLSTNVVRVGEAVRLTIIIRARAGTPANLSRLVPPAPPKSELWQVLEAVPSGLPPQILQAQGFTTFQYTLIPLSQTATETPAIPYSFFDLDRKTYADLTIPPVPLKVEPGSIAADLKTLLQPGTQGEPEEEVLSLSGLARTPGRATATLVPAQLRSWFPFVQLCPVFAFVALCGWDRRRRYLEQHPDILLRRRARRALRRKRREVRRASRAGDAPRFAGAVINALQIACSPHYPAEPRALVGADVLQVVGNGDQFGEMVRRFFAIHDASQFAGHAADAVGLLPLAPQIEVLLERLETRL